MSEAQALTLALTTFPTMIVILIGIFLNNARMNDLKDSLRAEIRIVEAQVKTVESQMDKNHSEMLHRFGDLDTRLTRIESGLGMNRG